jgi:hypothetical protein
VSAERKITKCWGKGCLLRDDCRRFVAAEEPDQHWYSFYATRSFSPETGCDYILPVLPDDDPGLAMAA